MLTPAPARAQLSDDEYYENITEERRPFEQGDFQLGVGFGYASRGDSSIWSVGGNFAYFVLPGLAPGLDLTYQDGSEPGDKQTWLLAPLKWVFYRSYRFSPYVLVQGGRIFLHDEGFDDLWIVGAGPGFYLFSSRRVGLFVQGIYYQLYPSDACGDCSGVQIGVGVGFLL